MAPKRKRKIKVTKPSGARVQVVRDVLKITGSGLYAVCPFMNQDKRGRMAIKIGMSTRLSDRVESYTLSYPAGVYCLAFLNKIRVPIGTRQTPSVERRVYLQQMETFVFNHVIEHGGKRLYSTARVRQPNERQEGITEWVYSDVDTIHKAFIACAEQFSGEPDLYYLKGVDSNGVVEDVIADSRRQVNASEHYIGQVPFRVD